MFELIDWQQVRALTKAALITEWRMASRRTSGRGKSSKKGWAIMSLVLYLLLGFFLINFFHHDATVEELLTSCSCVVLYIALITASNIFMSFGTGFLNPDEVQIISSFPVSSETFFTSRLVVLLSYSSIISISIGLAPVIAMPIIEHAPWYSSLGLIIPLWLSSIAAALAVIVFYGFVLAKVETKKRSRLMSYAQFFGSFLTTASLVVLPRLSSHWNIANYTIRQYPWLSGIPATWFASWMLLFGGWYESHALIFVPLAVAFFLLIGFIAFRVLGSHYQASVGELVESTHTSAKEDRSIEKKRSFFTLPRNLPFVRAPETRAIWTIFRAQFRFDTKFRLSLLSVLPITLMYLAMALTQGGIRDPFVEGLRGTSYATLLYMFALLSPMIIFQSISQTEQFKASWIFFTAPVDRGLLLIAVRNTLMALVALPYMIVLFIAFSLFIPVTHALMHIAILAGISLFCFQMYLMVSPRMPFAQQRRPNKNNFAIVLATYLFAAVAMGLLALIIYFGYRDTIRYFSSLALLITLSLVLEQFLRSRLRRKLDKEEFEG